ncbi:DNA-3-methyladenine glycosylase [bacterium]|nr:DNA-3-methyladenine glycosylase [bacterium]
MEKIALLVGKRLEREFYQKPTIKVSKELLGKYLVRKINKKLLIGRIVETEAYIGPQDKAAHSFNWRISKRNIIEYAQGGYIYIYLVYGMYWQLNIVTSSAGRPECVLIRALEPITEEKDIRIASGPGKLCKWLKLDSSFYAKDLSQSRDIWVAEPPKAYAKIDKRQIVAAKRIGIDYAKEWKDKLWRFYLKSSPAVSKK